VPPFVGLARSAANVPDVVVQLGRRQPIPYLSQGSLHDGRQGHPQSAPGMVWHGLGITSCTSSMGWHDLVRRGGPIVANPISPGVARRRRLGPLRAKAAWVPFVRCHPCNEWAAPVVPRCVEPFAVSRVLTAYSSVLPCHALPPPRLALLCNDWIWTAVVPGRMDDGWMDGWMDREPLASLRHPACRPGTSLHAWAPDLLFGLLGAVVDVPARCERQRSCHVLSMRDRVLIPRSGADCPGASAGAHLHQLRGSPPPRRLLARPRPRFSRSSALPAPLQDPRIPESQTPDRHESVWPGRRGRNDD